MRKKQPPKAAPDPAPTVTAEPLAYPVATAAAVIGLSRATLYRLIQTGELETFTVGRRRLVSKAALERWIAGKSTAPPPDLTLTLISPTGCSETGYYKHEQNL